MKTILHYLTLLWLSVHTIQAQTPMQSLKVLFAGDAMQHMPQVQTSEKEGWKAHFDSSFRYVRPLIKEADIAVVNFETTIGDPPFSGYPNFSTSKYFAEQLCEAGFDLFMLSNNHILDKGAKGLNRTIEELKTLGKPYIGAYNSEMDKRALYPLIMNEKGFKIGFLSYTYGTNSGLPASSSARVNYIDTVKIAQDIELLKREQPDVIIAMLHWGNEYQLQPSEPQKRVARFMFRNGVDAVIGSHPHVVQPVEVIRDTACRVKNIIAYSLGNFVSNQYFPYTQIVMNITLHLEKHFQKVTLLQPRVDLYWVDRSTSKWGRNYALIPLLSSDKPDTMSSEEWVKMQKERTELRKKLPMLFDNL